ncbi:MAG: hypothetical protein NVS2B17_22980 [Candidatus Velthaea sp.]
MYYTPVAAYYAGPLQAVYGCSDLNCSRQNVLLGSFPSDFVQITKTEGTGKLGPGQYLNWSGNIGYWLDTSSRDAQGNPLIPYRTAAADTSVAFGTTFKVIDCGLDTISRITTDANVCKTYQTRMWTISDRFTAGTVGKHLDLFIGEQDSSNFSTGAQFIDASNAIVQF